MANLVFAISQFFAIRCLEADGKELLCHPLADSKELADGKVADSGSVKLFIRAQLFLRASSPYRSCAQSGGLEIIRKKDDSN